MARARHHNDMTADPMFLAKRRVKTTTANSYAIASAEFSRFAKDHRLPLRTLMHKDEAMVRFMNHLYLVGRNLYAARTALFGVAFVSSLNSKDPNIFPKARLVLKGFAKSAPGAQRDPLPWEALLLMVDFLWSRNHQNDQAVAQGLVVMFDGYLRLNELLSPTGSQVTVLKGRASMPYRPVSVTLAPKPHSLADHRDSATKSGEFDDTIVFGDDASQKAPRGWIPRLLVTMKRDAGPLKRLVSVTAVEYETAFFSAVQALNLRRLKCRHGGPSTDVALGVRGLAAVARRGRWKAGASVRRYEKCGRLSRQVSLLTPPPLELARRLAHELPQLIAG